jgi:LysR family glycine cleavage system transcriptional activator
MDLPSLDNLRCFLAAADTLNFRAAARAVHLTPAAFGQRIRQLEDQLGVAVFARTTRAVALTTEGLALLGHARRVVDLAADSARVARGELGPVPVELTLGTRHELGMSWIVPQLDTLCAAVPGLSLHLYFGSGDDLLLRLRSREVDVAVTSSRLADPRLDAVALHPEAYVFCGAAELLDARPFTRRAHAAQHTLVDTSHDLPLYRYWRDAPEAGEALSFGRVWRLGTIEAMAWAVRSGRAVAVLPQYLMARDLKRGVVRTILPSVTPLRDAFRLVFRADDPRRPTFLRMAEAMRGVPLR